MNSSPYFTQFAAAQDNPSPQPEVALHEGARKPFEAGHCNGHRWCYKYDPRASRNEAVAEIASDLAKLGVALDVDTVRKRLREGAELLPPPDEARYTNSVSP